MVKRKGKGITIEFINTPKAGAKLQRGAIKGLADLAKLNKADRIIIVFDRE